MPLYEYRCRTCDATFETRRPMMEANAPAACPDGHADSIRLLSAFAAVGAGALPLGAGARCGAQCACHPG